MWKNNTQPQQPGIFSSCWSLAWPHTAVRRHPILKPALVTSQPTWLCHSGTNSAPKLIPQVVQRSWGQGCWVRPFHPLHFQTLGEQHCDVGGWSFVPNCEDRGLPLVCRTSSRHLSSLILPLVMTSPVFPVKETPPHTIPLSRSEQQSA